MGTGKPQKFFSNISNNEIIPDENFPNYCIYIYMYIYKNNLKIMNLKRGVGINHCYKK